MIKCKGGRISCQNIISKWKQTNISRCKTNQYLTM